MGAVYRARDLHFQNVEKQIAVKEMVNQVRDPMLRESIVRNFEREANILATLSHPAIPRIYDFFTQNERSYLILEFIEGKDLDTILNDTQGFFPEAIAISWGIELCEVLEYLHNHKPDPLIFRVMKPSNIMITPQNHIILIDFGIAKPFQSGPKGTMIGTEGYSPPEQYRGEATPSADIYALGATLHHILTRRDPRLEAPFSFNERPIRQINPSVSVEMETLINTAVHYNPGNRFSSAQAMKEALISTAKKAGIQPNVNVGAAPTIQFTESARALWNFECEDEIRGTPTFHNDVVYIGSYDNNLYALNGNTGVFIWKYATEGGIVSKPLVFDNNLMFGSEDKRLHVINSRSGKLVWTYYTDKPIHSSPRLAEGHIFIGSDDGYLHAINALTGRRAWRADAGAPVHSTPLIQGDAVYFGAENGEFYCTNLGGTVKWRFRAKRSITSSPAHYQGLIIVGSADWYLYALDAKTGWVVWRYRMDRATICSPCIADTLVFSGSSDGNIYCLDARTSKEVWHFTTEHQVTGSPIIYKDSLYCGSVDGYLYCMEYRTGRLRWKYKTNGPITGTPVAGNDVIYIGSSDHHIYALAA